MMGAALVAVRPGQIWHRFATRRPTPTLPNAASDPPSSPHGPRTGLVSPHRLRRAQTILSWSGHDRVSSPLPAARPPPPHLHTALHLVDGFHRPLPLNPPRQHSCFLRHDHTWDPASGPL
eukprot:scaffold86183_cov30-Tisochrysis_lutea.AAC.2